MKTKQFLNVAGLCTIMAGFSAQAALLGLQSYQNGPFYSNFENNQLDVNYVYSGTSTSGSGVFTVSDPYQGGSLVTEGESYTSGSKAPGTSGAYNQTGFTGSYSLSANISYNNGVATLTGGTFDIYGSLFSGGTPSTLLLQGNLVTGAGGSAFGYVNNSAGLTQGKYDEFDFLINLKSITGNAAIVSDFLKYIGGDGGIILNSVFDATGHTAIVGGKPTTVYNYNNGSTATSANLTSTNYQGFDGLWNQNFANEAGQGYANTFVPEPARFSAMASLAAAAAGLVFGRRRFSRPARHSRCG